MIRAWRFSNQQALYLGLRGLRKSCSGPTLRIAYAILSNLLNLVLPPSAYDSTTSNIQESVFTLYTL